MNSGKAADYVRPKKLFFSSFLVLTSQNRTALSVDV